MQFTAGLPAVTFLRKRPVFRADAHRGSVVRTKENAMERPVFFTIAEDGISHPHAGRRLVLACLMLFLCMSIAIAGEPPRLCSSPQDAAPSRDCMRRTDAAPAAVRPRDSNGWLDQALHIALRPISGATDHHVEKWASWHGRAMVLAWGFLLPIGVLVARYFKVPPGQDWPAKCDNKTWWHWHRVLQYAGVLVMTAGLAIVLSATAGKVPWRNPHTLIGWIIVILAWVQIASGHLRGSKGGPADDKKGAVRSTSHWAGDHYDMTPRRILFERAHKTLGYGLLLLSSVTIFLGLAIADAPIWMWAGQIAWTGLMIAAFAWWQWRGRCIDTYQAIWGPDPKHPGNRMLPIGWGIRRYTAQSYDERFRKKRRR